MGYLEHELEIYERCLEPFKKPDGSLYEDLSHDDDRVKDILRNIEELKKKIKMREITKPYYELLKEGIKYIRADDSVKSLRQATNLLKKDLTEIAEEIDGEITICRDDIKISNKNPVWWSETIYISLRKSLDKFQIDIELFDINDVLCDDLISFKQYRALLFLVSWLFKSPTEENMSLLRETVKRMKNEFYVNQKIDEMNTNLLENSLVMLAKKHGIKYQIEKDNTFCTVTFRLRPYYKLKVRLLYPELSQQLSDLSGVLEKSLEITAFSLVPQIYVNRSYAWLSK